MQMRVYVLVAVVLGVWSAAGAGSKELMVYMPFDHVPAGAVAGRGWVSGGLEGRSSSPATGQLAPPPWGGGNATVVDGKFGKGLAFRGQPQRLAHVPLPLSWFNDNMGGLTVFAWAKASGRPSQILFGVHEPASSRLYAAVGQAGCWSMGIQNKRWGEGGTGKRVKADGGWHAVAVTMDRGKATLYLDGAPIVEKAYTRYELGAVPAIADVAGGSSRGLYFEGTLDEFAVYKGALTPDEIREAMGGIARTALFKTYRPERVTFLMKSAVYRAGVVAHWAFDGDDARWAFDSGPLGLHGKLVGTRREAEGEARALRLTGTLAPPPRGGVEVPDHPSFGGWTALSVEAWLKWEPKGQGRAALLAKVGDPPFGISLDRASGLVSIALATDKGRLAARTTSRLPTRQWAHLVATWDSRTAKAVVYVDGKPQWTGTLAGSVIRLPHAPLLIGANGFVGLIDSIRIYECALPADFVAASYAVGAKQAQ